MLYRLFYIKRASPNRIREAPTKASGKAKTPNRRLPYGLSLLPPTAEATAYEIYSSLLF